MRSYIKINLLALAFMVLGALPARAEFGGIDLGGIFGGGGGTLGTKFCCCSPESVSTLGGGGGTIWHKMLADRALTQVDAKIRCGVYQMFWNTHSCPDDSVPSDGVESGGSPRMTSLQVCNRSSFSPIAFSYAWFGGGSWRSKGWYLVASGACQSFGSFGTGAADVYVYGEYQNGNRQWTQPDARFCIHKTDRFEYPSADTRACDASWVKVAPFKHFRLTPGILNTQNYNN